MDGADTGSQILTRGVIGELFYRVQDPVLILCDGIIEAANPAAQATLPGGDHLVGAALTSVFADDHEQTQALAASTCERRVHDGDGRTVWSASSSVLGEDENLRRVVVLRDISRSSRYTDALRGLNDVARRLLTEPTPEVVYDAIAEAVHELLDAEFTAVVVLADGSDAEIAHFAYHAPREAFPARLPRAVGLLAVPLATGQPARLEDIRGHPAGVGIPVEHPPIGPLVAVPIQGADKPLGELAAANPPGGPCFDEIDEAVLVELAAHAGLAIAIAEARLAQQRADEARVGYSRLALHNLRTPLAVALGGARTLQRHADRLKPAQRDEMLATLTRALERVTALSEESVLTSMQLADHIPEPAEVDVSELLRSLADRFAEAAEQRDVAVEVVADPLAGFGVDDASAVVDRKLVEVAVENLLSNAVKHAPAGTVVTVTHRREAGKLRVDVTDRGCGIPSEEQHRIFEGFYRTTSTRELGIPGAGVGLASVRRMLTAFGGTVGVSSQPGAGATFWVTIPEQKVSAPVSV